MIARCTVDSGQRQIDARCVIDGQALAPSSSAPSAIFNNTHEGVLGLPVSRATRRTFTRTPIASSDSPLGRTLNTPAERVVVAVMARFGHRQDVDTELPQTGAERVVLSGGCPQPIGRCECLGSPPYDR